VYTVDAPVISDTLVYIKLTELLGFFVYSTVINRDLNR
jgi:hypothetical protein